MVQHLILRKRLQARLGDTGAVSQHRAGKAPCGLLTHCHMDGCRQPGYPSGDAQFGAHRCPSLLWYQPHWHQLTVPGKQWHLLRVKTPLTIAGERNKTVLSPPRNLLQFLQYFQYCL